jgi:hypothetical protein
MNSSAYETSNLRPYTLEKRAPRAQRRVALLRCLRPPSLPDPFGQLPRPASAPDSRKPTVRPTNRAQRHPLLQRTRPRCPKAGLFAPQRGPRRLRRAERPRLARAVAPFSEGVWQRRHLVDTGVRCGGQLRGGPGCCQSGPRPFLPHYEARPLFPSAASPRLPGACP